MRVISKPKLWKWYLKFMYEIILIIWCAKLIYTCASCELCEAINIYILLNIHIILLTSVLWQKYNCPLPFEVLMVGINNTIAYTCKMWYTIFYSQDSCCALHWRTLELHLLWCLTLELQTPWCQWHRASLTHWSLGEKYQYHQLCNLQTLCYEWYLEQFFL